MISGRYTYEQLLPLRNLSFASTARERRRSHSPPGDNDFGSFRSRESLQHAIAIHDDSEFFARAHVTDPVWEGRTRDTVATEVPGFIHGIGAKQADASRHRGSVFFCCSLAALVGRELWDR